MEQIKPNIDLMEKGKRLACDECGNPTFTQVHYIFKISKLLTGDSQDSVVPIPTFACSKCGHINQDFSIPDREEKKLTLEKK